MRGSCFVEAFFNSAIRSIASLFTITTQKAEAVAKQLVVPYLVGCLAELFGPN